LKNNQPWTKILAISMNINIGSCSVKTIADRHRHAAYHNKQ